MYSNSNLEVKRGDIYLSTLDGAFGSEQQGERPVLITQNDIGNRFSPTVIGVSITSQISKAKLPTHIEIDGCGLEKPSVILTEQIRTLDKRRLGKYIGHIDEYMMQKVENALCVSLKIGDTRKEKIAKEKALEVRQLDLLLSRLVKYNIDSKDFTDTLKERELYLNDLISFCESNKLNYREFYSMSGEERQKVAV